MPCVVIDTDDAADLYAPPPKRPALQDPLRRPQLSFASTDTFHSSELRDWSICINTIMKAVIMKHKAQIYTCIELPMGIMISMINIRCVTVSVEPCSVVLHVLVILALAVMAPSNEPSFYSYLSTQIYYRLCLEVEDLELLLASSSTNVMLTFISQLKKQIFLPCRY